MEVYEKFEKNYAKYIGTEYAVSTNTGTSALHLALVALGVGKGDEVIIPEFTMIACAWAVTYTGAKPVFVDCGNDLLIDVKKIEEKITKKTKVIMPVHIYGRICNMDKIMEIAKKHNLRVLEDCCEAQGGMWKNKVVGSFDIGVFSFYSNKILPAEEGGMITTNDMVLYNRAKMLKSMSFTKDHDYYHPEIGFNYRMTNTQAGIANLSLTLANTLQAKRYQIESWYEIHINPKYKMPERNVVWVYDIKHPKADKLVKFLNEKGITARHGFKPMSMQPMYLGDFKKLKAYKLSKQIMYLPVNPIITEEDVKYICSLIDAYDSVL
jgi:dTDP-4-amino-4,6-dideoxygalactose transaminase